MRRVVVTGMGLITPVGNDVATFWSALVAGKNGIGLLTKFDTTEYKVKLAAEVKDFDPNLYMDRSEIRKSDLFSQYAMASAVQAVSDSKILGNINPDRLGVYFGSGIGGLVTISDEIYKLNNQGPRRVSPHFIPMMIANMAAGNIAIKFNAQGPCLPVTTACATGTSAIGESFRAIRDGYADAIITGGAEAAITPIGVAGFTNCMALSTSTDPAAASIPFDKRRSGFVIGEGSGAIILEDYEHALKRGAAIYAEMSGYGSTCDAYHITAPNPEARGASRALVDAVRESGMDGENRIYLNAHGTSTLLNDKAETVAIHRAFGENAYRISISSIKSMTGHMLGASGAVEAIASIMALRDGIVPPTIGLEVPDPECDLDYTPKIAKKMDIALSVSLSLGFGGHNACIAFKKVG